MELISAASGHRYESIEQIEEKIKGLFFNHSITHTSLEIILHLTCYRLVSYGATCYCSSSWNITIIPDYLFVPGINEYCENIDKPFELIL